MTYCRGDVGFYGEVKEYMEMLQEEDPTKYEAHFSKYIEAGIDAEKMEDMYTEAHEKIREDPDGEKAEKKDISYERDGDTMKASDGTEHTRSHKITLEQRREKVLAKIAAAQAKMMEEWASHEQVERLQGIPIHIPTGGKQEATCSEMQKSAETRQVWVNFAVWGALWGLATYI